MLSSNHSCSPNVKWLKENLKRILFSSFPQEKRRDVSEGLFQFQQLCWPTTPMVMFWDTWHVSKQKISARTTASWAARSKHRCCKAQKTLKLSVSLCFALSSRKLLSARPSTVTGQGPDGQHTAAQCLHSGKDIISAGGQMARSSHCSQQPESFAIIRTTAM